MAGRVVKVELSAQVAQYIASMQQAAAATKKVGEESQKAAETSKAWKTAGATLTAVGAAITAVGVASLKTGIQYNQLQQSSRAALTTLLGSARAANEQMDKLDAFARTSPFSKATFIQAQQQMLAFGIETKKVIPYLDAVQNAVAASGGSNADIAGLVATMSKIKSSAKLTATDLMEFGNRGVDAAGLIGQAMGKTGAQIRSEITAGTLDADAALDALTQGMSEKFGGAADNVKNTFSGAMDRVSAAWRDFSAELAKPLVDPNGGGALVDLLNWSADALRNFSKLPEPVKATTTGLAGLAGVGALATGSLILLAPKAIEAYEAFKKLSDVMPRTSAGLSAFAKVGAGAAVGITAAAVAGDLLTEALRSMGQEAEVTANKVRTAATATELIAGAAANLTGDGRLDIAAEQLRVLGDTLDEVKLGGQDGLFQAQAVLSVEKLGVELGKLATTDLPAAQAQFRLLAEGAGLSEEQQQKLLEKMGPYRQALTAQATASGRAATDQELLNGTMGDAVPVTEDQQRALEELQGVATDTTQEVNQLADAIRNFGSAQFDTERATVKFYEAFDDLNAILSEGKGSLDVTTEAGQATISAMLDSAQATNDYAGAVAAMGGSTEEVQGILEAGRQKIIDTRIALGDSEDAARLYADQLIATPENVRTQVELVGAQAASDALDRILGRLNAIPSTKNVTVQYGEVGWGVLKNSTAAGNYAGGIYDKGVKAFYSGGFASGIYAGVKGGIHKFAESEMGVPWETYISGRAADRGRNIGIWQETGRRLGVESSTVVQAPVDVDRLADRIVNAIANRPVVANIGVRQVVDAIRDYQGGRR